MTEWCWNDGVALERRGGAGMTECVLCTGLSARDHDLAMSHAGLMGVIW